MYMQNFKVVPIVFLFVLLSNYTLSQSIDVYGGVPYYFMQLDKYGEHKDVTNNANFMVGVSVNKYINTFKIELGVAYGTKNYTFCNGLVFLDRNLIILNFLNHEKTTTHF